MSALSDLTTAALLRLADEELFVGHVLTARAGWGPELELNLAMSSIGQDEIGHARLLYGIVTGDSSAAAIDELVYDRPAAEFHVSALSAADSQDWAELVVKHWLYELADAERIELLAACPVAEAAEAAGRMRHEEVFHREFWTTWLARTLEADDGTARTQRALDVLWPTARGLFDLEGIAAPSALEQAKTRWHDTVSSACASHGLALKDGPAAPARVAEILAEMRSVYMAAPGRW
jgi:ring-1,2-phenylacetyl-CoA epoxidase subunit PaaC